MSTGKSLLPVFGHTRRQVTILCVVCLCSHDSWDSCAHEKWEKQLCEEHYFGHLCTLGQSLCKVLIFLQKIVLVFLIASSEILSQKALCWKYTEAFNNHQNHYVERTNLWLAASFAFDLFEGFDEFLALGAFFLLLGDGRLAIHFHPASPLLGEQLWVDPRQNPSIWYGHAPQKLTERTFQK